jgi:hypothetical protein
MNVHAALERRANGYRWDAPEEAREESVRRWRAWLGRQAGGG